MAPLLLPFVVVAVVSGPLEDRTADSRKLVLSHCVVSLIDEAQVPAVKPGKLDSFAVGEGKTVQKGDVLAAIDHREADVRRSIADAEWRSAEKEAENDVDVRYAIAAAGVAEAELDAANDLNKRVDGTVADAEVRRLRLAAQRGVLGIEQAKHKFDVTKINAEVRRANLSAAELEVAERSITSPIDGVIVRVYRHEGEWVNLGDPICHIVRLNRLRITGFVNSNDHGQEQIIGKSVTVNVRFTTGKVETFQGHIGFTSPVVEPGGEYRVWAEVENRQKNNFWVLRPGLSAEMEIDLASKPVIEAAE
jgi:multidrug resistance efflux pump